MPDRLPMAGLRCYAPRPASRGHRFLLWATALGLFLGTILGSPALAATYPEQKAALAKLKVSLRAAERLAAAGRNDAAAEAYAEAVKSLETAADGLEPKLKTNFERCSEQLEQTRTKLAAAGVTVGDKKTITPQIAEPQMAGGPTGEKVSFVGEIAPMLAKACGGCHVAGRRGGLSFMSYNELMKGGDSGAAIAVGVGAESLLVVRIAEGSMPPDPSKAPSPAQTARLVRWINQGAKFDGDDPAAAINGMASTPVPATDVPMEEMKVARPKGNETVSFALDVAPILVAQCLECHNAAQTRGGLDLANFTKLLEGGDTGASITPGKAETSLLVQKIRGTAAEGAKMPLNRPALSDFQIEKIATWVNEGAVLDGDDPAAPLARLSALVRAAKSTPEELGTMRREAAARQWRLALPDEPADQKAGDGFLVVGNLPQQRIETILVAAQSEFGNVRKYFGWKEPNLLKGPLTIYAFPNRIDYAEFCTMVENRELNRGATEHARFDIVEPYVAIVFEEESVDDLEPRLGAMLGEIGTASRGQGLLPAWFTTGSGRAAAAKQHAKSALVKKWREALPAAISAMHSPADLLDGKLAPSTTNLLALAYIEDIHAKPANYNKVLAAVADGESLEDAVRSVYKMSLEELTQAWLKSRQK